MNNDLIRRGDAVRTLNERYEKAHEYAISVLANGSVFQGIELVKAAMHVVEKVPAVDAVEVVRCKDCRMAAMLRKPKGEVIADCMLRKFHTDDEDFIEVRGDDFCSYGERRKDDGEIQKETR